MMRLRDQTDVANFERDALTFCDLIESCDAVRRGPFVWRVGDALAELYAAATKLPPVEPTDADADVDVDESALISSTGYSDLFSRLSEHLGELDIYRVVFDPYDAEEPVTGSLADDLADIYRDIKSGFLALDRGDDEADVIWEWRFSFGTHWGLHALRALYAIHSITRTAGAQWISPDD
jgi:hypothetical protein